MKRLESRHGLLPLKRNAPLLELDLQSVLIHRLQKTIPERTMNLHRRANDGIRLWGPLRICVHLRSSAFICVHLRFHAELLELPLGTEKLWTLTTRWPFSIL
jgi:hypothetical protein